MKEIYMLHYLKDILAIFYHIKLTRNFYEGWSTCNKLLIGKLKV
jgi:hypothetical protein